MHIRIHTDSLCLPLRLCYVRFCKSIKKKKKRNKRERVPSTKTHIYPPHQIEKKQRRRRKRIAITVVVCKLSFSPRYQNQCHCGVVRKIVEAREEKKSRENFITYLLSPSSRRHRRRRRRRQCQKVIQTGEKKRDARLCQSELWSWLLFNSKQIEQHFYGLLCSVFRS